ncbi:Acyl-CoA synthetase (AMP-forming)/AMP-acid ligase II [Fontibacillus panacisegetis]|uniref:Acyl-CoA synthetase (AMP-forming)/AMP-acid ligase II n=1 Tax=Fontibacillus panacisegetis TaxID=670482 RepID=A0A1G7Q1E5_9BACL|nr:class I adenylate-forming enzyme family protein [Fontibacillus panacisegetis]SDF91450.1 Acyl-CoA synthetase (AMP-forming)/AMP-acid ligase II [Fontibacillus panacisegetis]
MSRETSFYDQMSKGLTEQVALNTETGSMTYGELRTKVKSFAYALRKHGGRSGDRIVIKCGYDSETVISILGAIEAGIVIVPVHESVPINRFSTICQEVGARITVTENIQKKTVTFYDELYSEKEGGAVSYDFKTLIDQSETTTLEIIRSGELAAIIFTSGTIGNQKGIMVSIENIFFCTKTITSVLNYSPHDRILSYLPLSFDYGLYQVFMSLFSQSTLYLRKPTIFTACIHKLIDSEEITVIPGMRQLFALICRGQSSFFNTVKCVTNTGEALPKSIMERMSLIFPNASIFPMYGLSECKRVSILPYEYFHKKQDSVGIPLPGTTVAILDELGNECSFGKVGQLVVSGPHVCMGYWRRERDKTFTNDGKMKILYTGDLFSRDKDGFLYFHGRIDDQFKHKGYRVDPAEIEEVILAHVQGVRDAAVVSVIDNRNMNKIVGCIIPDSEPMKFDFVELVYETLECCKKYLEPWKIPSEIKLFSSFPLSLNGKTNRKRLIQILKGE